MLMCILARALPTRQNLILPIPYSLFPSFFSHSTSGFRMAYEDWIICATIFAQVSTPRVLLMVM